MRPLDAESGFSGISPFAKWGELQTCYWQEWSKPWVKLSWYGSIFLWEFSLDKSVNTGIGLLGGSRSPDRTANHSWAIMLVFSEVVGRGARLQTCLGELLSKPRRGWMIKREIRDSWLNWRLHLGTKNLNKSLGPWATYFPWKVCIFSPAEFCWGLHYWGMNWDGYVELI